MTSVFKWFVVVDLYSTMPKVSSKMCSIVGILFLVLCSGCQDQKGLPREALNPGVSRSMELPGPSWKNASVEVISADVIGDSLRVIVGYGGGCGDHRFSLVTSGPAMKSLPPKQPVILVHESTGDPCRALIRNEQMFDLSRYKLSPHGTTIILLDSLILPFSYD